MARYSKPNRDGFPFKGTVDTLRELLDELGLEGDARMTTHEARDLMLNRRGPYGDPRSRDRESMAISSELHDRVPLDTMYHWIVSDDGLTRDELLARGVVA